MKRATQHIPKFVLLFPVRRMNSHSRVLWEKIAKLVNSNRNTRLILIDKTSGNIATAFFVDVIPFEKLTFRQENPERGMFSSLSNLYISENEWVAQIHDDDDFGGSLEFDEEISTNTLLRPTICIKGKKPKSAIDEDDFPPAFILFSFLPANLWNQFIKYIDAQGANCSPALDVALSFAARSICSTRGLPGFNYEYSNDNWSNRISQFRSLRRYMVSDGWGALSNSIVAEFQSRVDRLIFAFWLENNREVLSEIGLSSEALLHFQASTLHRIRIQTAIFVTVVVDKLLSLGTNRKFSSQLRFAEATRLRLGAYRLIFATYKSRDLNMLILLLQFLSKEFKDSPLQNRIDFWTSYMQKQVN